MFFKTGIDYNLSYDDIYRLNQSSILLGKKTQGGLSRPTIPCGEGVCIPTSHFIIILFVATHVKRLAITTNLSVGLLFLVFFGYYPLHPGCLRMLLGFGRVFVVSYRIASFAIARFVDFWQSHPR